MDDGDATDAGAGDTPRDEELQKLRSYLRQLEMASAEARVAVLQLEKAVEAADLRVEEMEAKEAGLERRLSRARDGFPELERETKALVQRLTELAERVTRKEAELQRHERDLSAEAKATRMAGAEADRLRRRLGIVRGAVQES